MTTSTAITWGVLGLLSVIGIYVAAWPLVESPRYAVIALCLWCYTHAWGQIAKRPQ